MVMYKYFFPRILLVSVFCLLLGGCSSLIDSFLLPEPELSAEDLFETANDAMRDQNYALSISNFTKLKENYPFSPYVMEAELSLADVYYLDEDWLMAAEAYKEFEVMHPKHSAMPYVLYQIGRSSMQTYVSVDRPPTLIHEAISYFIRLRESFPGDEYAEKSEEQIKQCRRILAEYEVYMADFFFRIKRYRSAWMRYKNVIADYRDIEDLYNYSLIRANAAYALQVEDEAEENRRAREGSLYEFFNWL
jgi:outer membrane protein assembly factor BamD